MKTNPQLIKREAERTVIDTDTIKQQDGLWLRNKCSCQECGPLGVNQSGIMSLVIMQSLAFKCNLLESILKRCGCFSS